MSSKGAGDENFPVASFLLPKWSRPHVMTFYAFARAADDVADAPDLSQAQKLDRLQAQAVQLSRGDAEPDAGVYALSQSLRETNVSADYAQDLLKAFMHDARTPRTANWDALLAYCQLSAAPVGRYLIDLLGGHDGADWTANDALCAALQILNHIQDVKDDLVNLDRVYVPADWMARAGVTLDDLKADACSPQLRDVLDRMLDGVDELLNDAKPMTHIIRNRALAREAGGIIAIARRLSKTLRAKDPLAGRVELSKPMAGIWFLWGALSA